MGEVGACLESSLHLSLTRGAARGLILRWGQASADLTGLLAAPRGGPVLGLAHSGLAARQGVVISGRPGAFSRETPWTHPPC